jgi:hypothetical protein
MSPPALSSAMRVVGQPAARLVLHQQRDAVARLQTQCPQHVRDLVRPVLQLGKADRDITAGHMQLRLERSMFGVYEAARVEAERLAALEVDLDVRRLVRHFSIAPLDSDSPGVGKLVKTMPAPLLVRGNSD